MRCYGRCAGRSAALLYRIAPPGLILLALTVTFAAIDVTMSLDPEFKSSVYGMLAAPKALSLRLAIAVLATVIVAPPAPERRRISEADARAG